MADLGTNAVVDLVSGLIVTTHSGLTIPATNPYLGTPRKFTLGTEDYLFDQRTIFQAASATTPAVSTPKGAAGNGADGGYWTGKDTTQGNPTAPSHRQGATATLRGLFWPVVASTGGRAISADVKMTFDPGAGKRPRLVVKRNTEVGGHADVTAEAGGGRTSWQTITVTVYPTADGVLEVWRERRDYRL